MPIITTTALTLLVTQLATKGIEKLIETGSEKITEDSYNWIKSLLYKDNKPKKVLKELENNPENIENQNIVKAIIENSIEDNPKFKEYLEEIIQKTGNIQTNIKNSKNINTGTINSGGGNVQIGDRYDK